MKGHLQKSLRVSAVIATMALGQLSAMAYSNAEELLQQLKDNLISQNYSTGPWSFQGTGVTDPRYGSYYDYNFGGGDVEGNDPSSFTFKNFYLPGLDVSASITVDNSTYNLNIDISKVYKINSGFKSEYTADYEGKYAKFKTLYKSDIEVQYNYAGTTDFGIYAGDDNKQYAYILPGESATTYTISFKNGGTRNNDLRSEASSKGLIIEIYNDEACTELSDAKTLIQGVFDFTKPSNAIGEDYDRNGNLIRRYKIACTEHGDSYDVDNLNSLGLATITSSTGLGDQHVQMTWNSWQNEVYFDGLRTTYSQIANYPNFKFLGYGKLSALKNSTDEVTAQEDATAVEEKEAYWFSYDNANRSDITYASEEENTYSSDGHVADALETFGFSDVDSSTINHNHTKTACPWIDDGENGGDRKTGSTAVDWYLYKYGQVLKTNTNGTGDNSTTKGSINYREWYSKTNIILDLNSLNKSLDYTLNVSLSLDQFGSNKNNIYVSGTITPNANTKFVDHYELCVKPGKIKKVSEFPTKDEPSAVSEGTTVNFATTNFGEYGYPGALNVYGDTYDFPTISESSAKVYTIKLTDESDNESEDSEEADDASSVVTFSKLIPKQAGWYSQENGDATNYSFYVRAVYKAEYVNEDNAEDPGLDPTYSSIQVPAGVTTGIESVAEEANDATVVGAQGEINVFGDVDNVAVYSISGAQIYNGNAKVIAVPTGIYIVKAGNTVAKVAVP